MTPTELRNHAAAAILVADALDELRDLPSPRYTTFVLADGRRQEWYWPAASILLHDHGYIIAARPRASSLSTHGDAFHLEPTVAAIVAYVRQYVGRVENERENGRGGAG